MLKYIANIDGETCEEQFNRVVMDIEKDIKGSTSLGIVYMQKNEELRIENINKEMSIYKITRAEWDNIFNALSLKGNCINIADVFYI